MENVINGNSCTQENNQGMKNSGMLNWKELVTLLGLFGAVATYLLLVTLTWVN
ncbi:hypothetical protein [Vibrio maerlii]|uniref:hypothetical protein n=1 Tax=Vibrio maerlii TaxID=2231648 RepID=UPI0013DF5D21|nr:hypothetical protein [Vibrio maerlii]